MPVRNLDDKGLEHILAQGYERLPNLSEMIGITIDVLNGSEDQRLVKMTTTEPRAYGWLNLAWEIKEGKLITYIKPAGLRWQEPVDSITKRISYTYQTPEFSYEKKEEFSLPHSYPSGIQKHKLRFYLSDFNDDFILFHIGRLLQHLPPDLKKKRGYN